MAQGLRGATIVKEESGGMGPTCGRCPGGGQLALQVRCHAGAPALPDSASDCGRMSATLCGFRATPCGMPKFALSGELA
jgi:hypothetical protein